MNQDMQPAAENAAIHSALYALFAEAFAYPRGELLDAIRSGDLAQRLQSWVDRLGPALTRGVDWAALADAGDRDDA